MRTVHLVCGVPGSGKTWVCNQLKDFKYMPHDDYKVNEYHSHLIASSKYEAQDILAEAPFRISVLIGQLTEAGVPVITYYIDLPYHIIKERYEKRSSKPFPKQHSTNLERYRQRPWDNKGSSEEILKLLREVNK